MMLVELEPRWIQPGNWAKESPAFYIGLSFLCPCCKKKRIAVKFHPPIDTAAMSGVLFKWTKESMSSDGSLVWNRSGNKFETITLNPSLDFSHGGHWHGNIINGEMVTSS